MAAISERRVRFRDLKPYFLPDSLSELSGPYSGLIQLRHAILWAPGERVFDISTYGGARVAYQALITEGKVNDQIVGLNRQRLFELWPYLSLDDRVRDLWEQRFPELKKLS